MTTPTSTQRSGARRAPRATPFSLHPAAAKRETASEEISPRKSPSAPAAAADGVAPKDTSPWRKVHRWPIAMVVILVILGVIALLLIQGARPDGLSLTSRTRGAATPDSTAAAPGAAELAPLGVINPAAASEASRYAVEIAVLNTRAGADMRLAELREISGSTIAPVVSDDGESWYRVFAGALRTRDSADSLQLELRSRGIQMADGNRVVELPYAIRLAVHPPNAEAAAEVDLARYISLGIPAYLLTQTDGSLTIYAAGFETLEQASHFGEFCASKGIPSRLAYRTGR